MTDPNIDPVTQPLPPLDGEPRPPVSNGVFLRADPPLAAADIRVKVLEATCDASHHLARLLPRQHVPTQVALQRAQGIVVGDKV